MPVLQLFSEFSFRKLMRMPRVASVTTESHITERRLTGGTG